MNHVMKRLMLSGLALIAFQETCLTAAESFVPDFRLKPEDYTVLMAADAKLPTGLKPFQAGAHGKFHVTGWNRLL